MKIMGLCDKCRKKGETTLIYKEDNTIFKPSFELYAFLLSTIALLVAVYK